MVTEDRSEETIYRPAVPQKREDDINTSDEFAKNLDTLLITERRRSRSRPSEFGEPGALNEDDGEEDYGRKQTRMTPEDQADNMIKEAERAKASIFPQQQGKELVVRMDEDYLVVGDTWTKQCRIG